MGHLGLAELGCVLTIDCLTTIEQRLWSATQYILGSATGKSEDEVNPPYCIAGAAAGKIV